MVATACLWNDIETYLSGAVTTDMGTTSSYTTLKIAEVELNDTFEAREADTYPRVVISSFRSDPRAEDDTFDVTAAVYRVGLTAAATATSRNTARTNAKELLRRLTLLVLSRYGFGGLAATDGERVWHTAIAAREARSYQLSTVTWVGVATVALDVHATIPE